MLVYSICFGLIGYDYVLNKINILKYLKNDFIFIKYIDIKIIFKILKFIGL